MGMSQTPQPYRLSFKKIIIVVCQGCYGYLVSGVRCQPRRWVLPPSLIEKETSAELTPEKGINIGCFLKRYYGQF